MIIEKPLTATSHFIEINESKMHYLEAGTGNPILFLHGVPTSSYLWRNIIPHLSPLGRCIAPDLIGFGRSDKPNIAYSIFDHINYIQKFIEAMSLRNVTLVMHGWGSVIGFHYAMNNENNCHALVFYEAFLRSDEGQDISLPYREQLRLLQEQSINDINISGSTLVEQMLTQQAMKQLDNKEMNHYRQPFLKNSSNKPIIQYLKEATNLNIYDYLKELITDYSTKLTHSLLPKLMLYSLPGFITTIATAMWAKTHLPNLEISDIGEELHLAQENCPELIGETISAWLQGVEQNQH
jgi:haloalkane dehalogenase